MMKAQEFCNEEPYIFDYTHWIYFNKSTRCRLAIFECSGEFNSVNIQVEVKTRRTVNGWRFKKKWRHSIEGNRFNKELSKFVKGLWL